MKDGERDCVDWVTLELMGHQMLAGRVSSETIGGTEFLRIDMYRDDEQEPFATQFYSGQAVYCISPTTEGLARKLSRDWEADAALNAT